jgi:hypothetical protein
MAVAAAPTTRKQVSATIVMALVKKVSIPADVCTFATKWMIIKALPCQAGPGHAGKGAESA